MNLLEFQNYLFPLGQETKMTYNTSIYKLILVLSSDYFLDRILPNNISLKIICRDILANIIHKDNYYLYTNFSEDYIKDVEINFFIKLEKLDKVNKIFVEFLYLSILFYREIKKKNTLLVNESINSFYEDIFYCDYNNTHIDFFLDYYFLNNNHLNFSEDEWINSQSDWDKYLISIMDDVPESICLYYEEMICIEIFKLSILCFMDDFNSQELIERLKNEFSNFFDNNLIDLIFNKFE